MEEEEGGWEVGGGWRGGWGEEGGEGGEEEGGEEQGLRQPRFSGPNDPDVQLRRWLLGETANPPAPGGEVGGRTGGRKEERQGGREA